MPGRSDEQLNGAQAQVKGKPKGLQKAVPPRSANDVADQAPRDLPPLELSITIEDAVAPKPPPPGTTVPVPGHATATVTVKARQAVEAFTLRISTRGVARTPGAEGFAPFAPDADDLLFNLPATAGFSRAIPKLDSGAAISYKLPLSLTKFGQGEVVAATAALGEVPSAISTTAHDLILIEGSEVISGGTTFIDLRVKQLQARMQAAGAPAAAIKGAINKLKRSGARTSLGGVVPPSGGGPALAPNAAPAPGAAPPKADPKADARGGSALRAYRAASAPSPAPAPSVVNVRGQVRFTDRSGGTHPVRFAYVEVKNPGGGSDEDPNFAQGFTDADGQYSLTFAPPGGAATPFNAYLVPYAYGDTLTVRDLSGSVYAVESEVRSLTPGFDNVIDVTAAYNTSQNTAANWAFAAYEAGNFISRFTETLGLPRAAQIDVYFPLNQEGAFYNGSVNIALSDAHDWDVVMHEYGHHLQTLHNLANYVPGPHFIGADVCALATPGKPNGVALAWGEGWPTFNGTLAQTVMHLESLGIPTVGDTSYTDLRPGGVSVIYDLEADTGPSDRGEGDEVAVQRVMWDFFRKSPHLSSSELWHAVADNHAFKLSDCWNQLVAGRPLAQVAQMGAILTAHGMGVMPTLPAEGGTLGPAGGVTFAWSLKPPGTICDGAGTSSYRIRFYKDDLSAVLLDVPNLTGTSFMPNAAQVAAIRAGGIGSTVRWAVFRSGLNMPQTGEYAGEFRSIQIQ